MKLKAVLLAGAACTACCAPLLLPFLAGGTVLGLGSATGLAFASLELGLLVAVLAALAWGVYRYGVRRRQRSCSCQPDDGCHAGSTCDIPVRGPSDQT